MAAAAVLISTAHAAAAPKDQTQPQSRIQPFLARGIVATDHLESGGGPGRRVTDGEFSFCYSNGWWQLEVHYQLPREMAGTVTDCRRIPDGVRLISLFPPHLQPAAGTNVVAPIATAYPIPFPPPLQNELFVCWLALCPDPELPVIGPGRIRRFLLPEWHLHPANEGDYQAKHLDEGAGFLAELAVSNNGVEFIPAGRTIQCPPPFEHGWLELKYEVLQATNWCGTPMPARAALTRYGRRPLAKTREDIYPTVVASLVVKTVEAWQGKPAGTQVLPARVIALDHRPPRLPKDVTVNYPVTNDQWPSVTNRELLDLASLYRRAARRASPIALWAVRVVLAALLLCPLAVVVWRRGMSKTKNTTGEQT